VRELYHYTCSDHGLPNIAATGVLEPRGVLARLVWLTDLATPNRDALGLTSHLLDCDRTEIQLRVPWHRSIRPWWVWRRAHPEHRAWTTELELAPGARPAHWFVSASPLPLDPKDLP